MIGAEYFDGATRVYVCVDRNQLESAKTPADRRM